MGTQHGGGGCGGGGTPPPFPHLGGEASRETRTEASRLESPRGLRGRGGRPKAVPGSAPLSSTHHRWAGRRGQRSVGRMRRAAWFPGNVGLGPALESATSPHPALSASLGKTFCQLYTFYRALTRRLLCSIPTENGIKPRVPT